MPCFVFTARDQNGAAVSGTHEGDSIAQVVQALRATGKYPTSVRPVEQAEPEMALRPVRPGIRVRRTDVIGICTQLAIMLDTGVPLSEALDCIAAQSERGRVHDLVTDLSEQVQGGSDFSSALARHPQSFPSVFVTLIRASEKSGMMARLLSRGVSYLRDEQETIRRVKGAMTYPAIMLGFAVTTTVFLLTFVLPRFTMIYANKEAALPLPTQILMSLSGFLVSNWLGLLTGLVLAVAAGWIHSRTASGARMWHRVQLGVPVLGTVYGQLHLSRGLRMVGTMAGAGVNLLDCVKTARDLCPNTCFRDLWEQVSEQLSAGRQLSEPLFHSTLVPRSITQMIHSAEKSGKLPVVLEQIAGYTEQELKERIANLTRYIEPLMIMIMGLIIGGIALALLLPIFTISRVAGH